MINFLKYFLKPVLRDLDLLSAANPKKRKNKSSVIIRPQHKNIIFELCVIERMLWNRTCSAFTIAKLSQAIVCFQNHLVEWQFPPGLFFHVVRSSKSKEKR